MTKGSSSGQELSGRPFSFPPAPAHSPPPRSSRSHGTALSRPVPAAGDPFHLRLVTWFLPRRFLRSAPPPRSTVGFFRYGPAYGGPSLRRLVYFRPGPCLMTCFTGGVGRKCKRPGQAKFSPRFRPLSRVLSEGGNGDGQGVRCHPAGKRRLRSAVPSRWTQFLPLCLLSPLPRGTRSFWDPCRCSTQPSSAGFWR